MRVHASLGSLASIAWLSSAATVPRADVWGLSTDTACTTTTPEQATVIVLPGQSAASYTALTVFTFTLPGDGSGLSDLVTVTVPGLPTPSAPAVSTVTVPVLTVTLPSPAIPSDSSIVTVTVLPGSSGTPEAPPTPAITATVPGIGASNSVGVITVTIPEGPSDTATVVLTVTVPHPPGWSSESTAPVTVPLETGFGSNSQSLLAPYTLTYTLPLAPSLTELSIATITVTPVELSVPTGVEPFATATLSSSVSSWSYVPSPPGTSVVSFTVSASGTVPAYTGVITVTPGFSWGSPAPSSAGDQSSTVTVTVPQDSGLGLSVVTVTKTPTANTDAGAQTPSIVAVTYTAPASLGATASEYTVTYTLSPSDGYDRGVVTVSEGISSVSDAVITTITPLSGSPIVITLPGASGLFSLSTIAPSPSLLTITPTSGSPIVVTLPAESTAVSASSGVFVTPTLTSYTIADSYGNLTTLTQWTYAPVLPSDSGAGAGLGGALSSTMTAQFITILPPTSPFVITVLPSAAPSTITIWPSTSSLLTSFISSTSCHDEDPGATNSMDLDQAQSNSAFPSEITLWPLPTSIDATCTTFSTSYHPALTSDSGTAGSLSSFSVITLWPSTSSPPYSVITIWSSSGGSALAGWTTTDTCTETETLAVSTSVILLSSVSTPFTTFPTALTSESSESSILAVPTETAEAPLHSENTESPPSQPENTEVPDSTSEDLIPPPQTFNRHGQHAQTTATFGGYAFSSSAAGYGDLPPGYGSPVETESPVSEAASVTIPDTSVTASVLPVSTTSTDLVSLLSSIISLLSATFVSGPGPVLTSIPVASSGSLIPTLTALPTTDSSLLVHVSSLTAAPIAPSVSSLSLNATAAATLSSNGTALSFISSIFAASSDAPDATLSSRAPKNVTSSSTSSLGLPASTCGAVGDRGAVVFRFDDIPTISTGNDTEASSFPAMPVPFPYHRFFFSNGFTVVAPPRTKFKPSSGEQLMQHNSSVSHIAEFGLAQLRANPCFHFSFSGVSLGCDSTTDPCVFNITGLRWNGTEDVVEARHTFEVAACSKKTDCSLSHQILNSAAGLPFSNLTSLNISLTVAGKPKTWWADDLQIAWADNDCTAAACRSRVPNTTMIPHTSRPFSSRAKRLLRWAVRGSDDKLR